MARMKRVKNVERTFVFDLGLPDESSVRSNGLYIDTMQCHSLVNRVFARQGHNVLIENLEIGVQPGGAFEATVLRLPQHWSCVNAWTKGMSLWRKQQDETAEQGDLDSTYARYRDFKVAFDKDHTFANNLIPAGYVLDDPGATDDSYEWLASQIVIPNDGVAGNTTERTLHMVGTSTTTRAGLIQAYAESRSRPFAIDPNIVEQPTGGIFGEMFDVGFDDEEIVDNFQGRNNEPPYLIGNRGAQEYYPGGSFQGIGPANASGTVLAGQFVDIIAVNAGQNYNTDSTGMFAAPCGLIKIVLNATGTLPQNPANLGDAPFSLWCKVTLSAGHYQGIAAQAMQEVN